MIIRGVIESIISLVEIALKSIVKGEQAYSVTLD